ncbi:MAG: adenylate/guanylate cyclase domain-containing protein, partial [Rhodospirillales bacterium]|nr:adenylate/guanylate cyclase domain-containing protein [Rhodospirillales bacterium]
DDHAAAAIRTAIEIQEILKSHEFEAWGKMNTRVGINTGQVIAGAVGADDRLNYTVHGDAVNVAARLEQLNKEFGTRILVSEEAKALAGDAAGCSFTRMGTLPIRGKVEEVSVYSVE